MRGSKLLKRDLSRGISEKPIRRTREGSGEWMGADKNSSWRRWRLQQDEHSFQHTSPTHYPSWSSPRSHWSVLDLGTNSQHHILENATEHKTRASLTYTSQADEHHQSDQSLLVKTGDFQRTALTQVRPVNHTGRTNPSQKALKHQTGLPIFKTTQTRNCSNTGQQRTHPNTHSSKT
jgi:hypothetical protein